MSHVAVRMDPALEREVDEAARRLGLSKSQYIVMAVERSLGRRPAQPVRHLAADALAPHRLSPQRSVKLGAEGSPLQKKLQALLRARLLTDSAQGTPRPADPGAAQD